MRIATWNINGLKARQDYLVHWLREVAPDVVGLQELKMPDEQFPHDKFLELGYHAVCHGQKSWNGVAVLSRAPASMVQRGLPGQEDLGARLLTVEVGDLSFTTVYCPNGKSTDHPDYARKLAWYDALIAHLHERRDKQRPAILCGDFNIVPAAIDTWNEAAFRGSIHHTDQERARLRALQECGFIDLYRKQHPEQHGFSWWDYRGGAFPKRQGLRIDLLYGAPGVVERMRDATVDRRWRKNIAGLVPSDHAPVWVDLE